MNLEMLELNKIPPSLWIRILRRTNEKKRKKLRSDKYNMMYEFSLSADIYDNEKEIESIKKEYQEKYKIDLIG